MVSKLILVINPGSTTTKLALFQDGLAIASETLSHDPSELAVHAHVLGQLPGRCAAVRGWLATHLRNLSSNGENAQLDAIAARGGLLHPLPSGAFPDCGAR